MAFYPMLWTILQLCAIICVAIFSGNILIAIARYMGGGVSKAELWSKLMRNLIMLIAFTWIAIFLLR